MLRLYIGNKNYSSWSLRPWLLMKTLTIPFTETLVPFGTPEQPHDYGFSPSGRVPCLVDGALTVWDSLAITEYLAESWPVWPSARPARAMARALCAEMHSSFSALRTICTMNCGLRVQLREWPPALLADWQRIDALWCTALTQFGGPYLMGSTFTAVDAFFAPVVLRAQTYTPTLSDGARGYVQTLLALPTLQAWYHDALQEPWREPNHEAEARAHGEVTADLRTRTTR